MIEKININRIIKKGKDKLKWKGKKTVPGLELGSRTIDYAVSGPNDPSKQA